MRWKAYLFVVILSSLVFTGCSTKNTAVNFKGYDDLNQKERLIADQVFAWAKKESEVSSTLTEQQLDQDFGIAKKDISIGFVHLNQDMNSDVLAIPGRIWCGSRGCTVYAFIAPDYHAIRVGKAFMKLPVRVKNQATDGLKNIILNQKTKCSFSRRKNEYACQFK